MKEAILRAFLKLQPHLEGQVLEIVCACLEDVPSSQQMRYAAGFLCYPLCKGRVEASHGFTLDCNHIKRAQVIPQKGHVVLHQGHSLLMVAVFKKCVTVFSKCFTYVSHMVLYSQVLSLVVATESSLRRHLELSGQWL